MRAVAVWETLSCYETCVGVGASRTRATTYFVYSDDEVMRTASFLDHVEAGLRELGIVTDHALELTPTGASTGLLSGCSGLVVEFHSLRLLRLKVESHIDLHTPVTPWVLDALDPCVLWTPSAVLPEFLRSMAAFVPTRGS